jgi:hypothetical protein
MTFKRTCPVGIAFVNLCAELYEKVSAMPYRLLLINAFSNLLPDTVQLYFILNLQSQPVQISFSDQTNNALLNE